MTGSFSAIASLTFCQVALVSGLAWLQSRFLEILMSAWAFAENSSEFNDPCGSSSRLQSRCRRSSRCEWTKGINPNQCLTKCTVIHCLMFSTLTSNSTSLIGLCSASNILAFHRSDGSLSVSVFPTVALAARRALFQDVAWNTLVIILVVSTSIRTGDYLKCKIEDF